MIKHFEQISNIDPNTIQPHPRNIICFGFRCSQMIGYIMLPIIDDNDPTVVDTQYFYCDKCKKWLKTSGTFGNIKAHVRCTHHDLNGPIIPELTPREKGILTRKMVLLYGLPFSFIENPILKILSPNSGGRHNLSAMCSRIAENVRRNIKNKYQFMNANIWITIDEWNDTSSQSYLGVYANILQTNGQIDKLCVAHHPLSAIHADAPYISGVLHEIFENFFPRSKIEGIVTDTTPLMPAIANHLHITWSPCYCHIINLLLQSFIQICDDKLSDLFLIQATLGSSTVFHNYIIGQNVKVTSLPSVCATRWFSLYKLMRNTIILQPQIQHFLENNHYDKLSIPPDEFFQDISLLINVFATAKNVMKHLESESFGTISYVIDAFRLIKHSVDNLPDNKFENEKSLFNDDYTHRWISHFLEDDTHDMLLMAARLNPYQTKCSSLTIEEINTANTLLQRHISQNENTHRYTTDQWNQVNTENRNLFEYGYTFNHFRDINRQNTNELELYNNIANATDGLGTTTDLYQFWKSQSDTLPNLSKLALKLLLRPASSASAERIFSKAKRMLDISRNSMSPSKISDSVMIIANPEIAEQYIT